MMAGIHKLVPKAERDAALDATKASRARKQLGIFMHDEDEKLERVCGNAGAVPRARRKSAASASKSYTAAASASARTGRARTKSNAKRP